jgi:riboflavin transporter FmnP
VCALAVAIIGNLIITPLYANISVSAVATMILPVLLPFNLMKLAIHGVVTFLIYKPISMLVHR